jgi:predicted transposase/invertase (TIGR01784 family)
MEIFNPHDKFFKETFSIRENVIDFFQGTIPGEILNKLDLSTLTLSNNSYIDEELKEHFSDIVYTCLSKNKELTIALLFEHKSYPETCPYLQLLKYLLKIWETNIKQTERLQPVIPVILYHGKEVWKVRRFSEYFEGIDETFCRFIPEFEYLLTDLTGYSNEEIKYQVFRRASLQIALLLMRNIFNEKTLEDNLKGFFEIGRQYFEEEEGLRFLESVIRYLYNVPEIAVERVIETVREISEEGGKLSMTIATKLIEKGKMEGKIEGLKEAIELGLELKYGVEGLKLLERINRISLVEKLESIKEAVKIAKSMEEIEKLL